MKLVTIEIDASEAGNLMAEWRRNLAELELQVEALKQRISNVQAQLGSDPTTKAARTNGLHDRVPRGQNISTVSDFLKSSPGKSAVDIAKDTGVALSSVMAVLNRRKDLFDKQRGLWSMKKPII